MRYWEARQLEERIGGEGVFEGIRGYDKAFRANVALVSTSWRLWSNAQLGSVCIGSRKMYDASWMRAGCWEGGREGILIIENLI